MCAKGHARNIAKEVMIPQIDAVSIIEFLNEVIFFKANVAKNRKATEGLVCVKLSVAIYTKHAPRLTVRVDWPCYASTDWRLARKYTRILPSQIRGKSMAASRKSYKSWCFGPRPNTSHLLAAPCPSRPTYRSQ